MKLLKDLLLGAALCALTLLFLTFILLGLADE